MEVSFQLVDFLSVSCLVKSLHFTLIVPFIQVHPVEGVWLILHSLLYFLLLSNCGKLYDNCLILIASSAAQDESWRFSFYSNMGQFLSKLQPPYSLSLRTSLIWGRGPFKIMSITVTLRTFFLGSGVMLLNTTHVFPTSLS